MMLKWMAGAALVLVLAACGPKSGTDAEGAQAQVESGQDSVAPTAEADEKTDEQEGRAMTDQQDPLTGTGWWVEDIGGAGVVDRSRSTVEFFEPGRVAGNSGCNRYTGGYERDGEALKFGVLAGTMMACPEALMNQEQRFHQAMGQVTAWRIDSRTDLLHLLDEAGETVIRASRLPADDEG